MGAFDYKVNYDTAPVGSVIQSPINLETVTNGKWIALDGRDCNRGAYPELSPYFPAGVFTSTARTLNTTPQGSVIAADSTNFACLSALTGTQCVQASADGITWTGNGGFSGAFPTGVSSLIVAGSRWVLASTTGALAVIATGGTAASFVNGANWTVCTGFTTGTTLTQGLAYGSTANAGAGRTVVCKNGADTTANSLFYMNDGATAWNACSGGSTKDRKSSCWTGQRFMAFAIDGTYQYSTDGATFVDAFLPVFGTGASAYGYSCASDGNGTVVITGTGVNAAYGMPILVSKDHGVTWRSVVVYVPFTPSTTAPAASFVNGRFVLSPTLTGADWMLMSSDGYGWQLDSVSFRGAGVSVFANGAIAYKAGTYCGIISGSTSAATWTEDMSKFKIQSGIAPRSGTTNYTGDQFQLYIKVRSN